MKRFTIFSFGYWGWGNATEQLIKAVDAVEKFRGFEPPKFIEVRLRRTGRAKGFVDKNFENLLGPDRYRWMSDLGNEEIAKSTGRKFKIRRPAAAEELLDEAIQADSENRRIIFFCGCACPKVDGKISCHRTPVASLVLRSARRRKKAIEIIEWPGGKPKTVQFDVSPEIFKAIAKGRSSIPLKKTAAAYEYAGLPWYSVAKIESDRDFLRCAVGPARCEKDQWFIPIFAWAAEDTSLTNLKKGSDAERKSYGLTSQFS